MANTVDLSTNQTVGGTKTFSNPITASAGTVSAPGITTTGDSNTGIFFPAADTIAFTEGGTEVIRIDASGNVGINTTSPGIKLGVVDTSAGSATFPVIVGNRGTTVGTQINIGLQTYDSGSAGITNAIGSVTTSASSGAGSADMVFLTTGSGTRAERMRISSVGYVTMPNQPAFHAVRNAGNVSSTGIFICNAVTFNDGNHYNSSTGRFTAPVAGRYQMNFFVLMQGGNNVDFIIRVNGSQYAGMDIRNNSALSSGNFTLSCSAIFKLSANDIVDPFISSLASGPVYGQGLNAFSMHFLG